MVIQAGFARSDHDSAMFVSVYPRGRAILLLYVDDIKLTGDYPVTISLIKRRLHQFEEEFHSSLCPAFEEAGVGVLLTSLHQKDKRLLPS